MLFWMFLFLPLLSLGNDTIDISIYVQNRPHYESEENKLKIIFEQNQMSCGPNSEFEDLGGQISYFYELFYENSLSVDHLEELAFNTEYVNGVRNPRKIFTYLYRDIEEMKKVWSCAKKAFAQNIELIYRYPSLENYNDVINNCSEQVLKKGFSLAGAYKEIFQGYRLELISIDEFYNKRIEDLGFEELENMGFPKSICDRKDQQYRCQVFLQYKLIKK